MQLPLRFSLRYHPLFLELGRHLRQASWGSLQGASLQASLNNKHDKAELVAFVCYLLGLPSHTHVISQASLTQLVFIYPAYALQLQMIVAEELHETSTFWGSLSFNNSNMVEIRFGHECWIAVSRREDEYYHVPLPEGSAEEYRRLDETQGFRVLPLELEKQVDAYIQSLSL
ncbi:hypothetical protein [Gracilinema caldarium]|uniref:hypothetical protein n=1 Tax=Gracilinema caldarium TaxID=215591 RepID=UPI0026F2C15B|nr:hypothetical protein [Gracilinema caldarium]